MYRTQGHGQVCVPGHFSRLQGCDSAPCRRPTWQQPGTPLAACCRAAHREGVPAEDPLVACQQGAQWQQEAEGEQHQHRVQELPQPLVLIQDWVKRVDRLLLRWLARCLLCCSSLLGVAGTVVHVAWGERDKGAAAGAAASAGGGAGALGCGLADNLCWASTRACSRPQTHTADTLAHISWQAQAA